MWTLCAPLSLLPVPALPTVANALVRTPAELPSEPVFGMLYRSMSSRPMAPADLLSLVTHSRRSNAERNVTGLLLYGNFEHVEDIPGAFMQWIEGAEADVRALFNKIARDDRHTDIHVLAEGEARKVVGGSIGRTGRLFPAWTMALEPISALPATADGFAAYYRDSGVAEAQVRRLQVR